MKKAILLSLLVIGIFYQSDSIRITRFVVPKEASFGALLELDCAYDLENDQLYDVKWFKDSEQFFRCKSDGQYQAFPTDGIQLYHNQKAILGSCPVALIINNYKSAGQYVCEISTEAPEFKTTAKSVMLTVSKIKPSKRIQDQTGLNESQETSTPKNGYPQMHLSQVMLIFTFSCLLYTYK